MKYSIFFVLTTLVCLLLPRAGEARIGERRDSFESRLFSNGGIVYRDRQERNIRRKSGPYTSYLKYLGGSAEVRVYFKSDDGRQPTQTDLESGTLGSGWEVHVLYVSGKSVLEQYSRIGSMSEYEMNALLAILGGGGYWEKAEPPTAEADEDEEPPPSAFGFDYVRSDGEVRAKKSGGGLMVFQKQLDEYLAKQHKSNLLESAPQSVRGF
jgi:hypothetical protein